MTPRPDIIVSTSDATRIEQLLASIPDDACPDRADLEEELQRAQLVKPSEVPPTVVTMNSTVRFRVLTTGREFSLTLVYPKDVNPAGGTISIFAPVGSALLGLAQGDEIEWPRPGGGTMTLRIEEVIYQPERAGEFHR